MNIATDIVNKVTGLLVLATAAKPVYKHEKPSGVNASNFTVVNCLPVIQDHFDQAFCNVNVHVKDMDLTKLIPDDVTLKTRSEAVITALNNFSDDAYDISLQQSSLFPDPETQTHYINLRFIITILTQN